MASSNRGLLIGCVALTVVGGGCVVTGIAAGAAWWVMFRTESVSPPIAFPSIAPEAPAPVGYPPVGAPVPTAPTPPPTVVAPVPTEVAPPEPAGVMHLTSVPDGARVSEGGVALGVTPLDVPVAPRGGSRTLSVEADGYLGSDVTIYDTPGSQQITLQAARAAEPEPAPARTTTASSGSRSGSGSGSSGSGSSGSGSSGGSSGSGSGSRSGSSGETERRPVAATIRPGGSGTGTTTRSGSSGSSGTSGTTRTGALSHDDF